MKVAGSDFPHSGAIMILPFDLWKFKLGIKEVESLLIDERLSGRVFES